MIGTASGTVEEALRLGLQLLRDKPGLAALQAREILAASPGNADAYRLLGAALRRAIVARLVRAGAKAGASSSARRSRCSASA